MNAALESLVSDLLKARKAKGLSQRALSLQLHMPQAHLSRMERGLVDMKISTLIEWARMLELDVFLVPRQNMSLIQAILRSPDDGLANTPMYALDDEE